MSESISVAAQPARPGVELLDDADRLFAGGDFVTAGAITQTALELYLCRLYKANNCKPRWRRRHYGIRDVLCGALRMANVFDGPSAREARHLYDVGARIVYGEPMSTHKVETFLRDVRKFIETMAEPEGGAR